MTKKKWKPNPREILEAKVRDYLEKHRPSLWDERVRARLSKKFGVPPHEFRFIGTYSRYCTHEFSEGPCQECPHSAFSPDGRPPRKQPIV
jgi:hypothetical protein